MKVDVVVGWTGDLFFFLKSDGDTPEGTMTGMTVELILKDAEGNQLSTSGDVSVVDEDTWKVKYSPDAADFAAAGNYRGRFKVTDVDGKVVFFPNETWDRWIVREVA